ncbi:MAG: hypothetical protein IJT16_03980 [Lachnospiraceae bacterium]|nr:hypothetical protein [Lachnospiraceae bacterium]
MPVQRNLSMEEPRQKVHRKKQAVRINQRKKSLTRMKKLITRMVVRKQIEIVIESIRSNHSIVLAEGVETEAEYLFLKNHADVKYMQGFYLGIPE